MAVYKLFKDSLPTLLKAMMDEHDVIAPVQRKETTYEVLKTPDEIRLDILLPLHPSKKFFLGEETIFEYDGLKVKETIPDPKTRIFFGLRRCDLHAIERHNMVFIKQEPVDPHFKARFDKSYFIGHHCIKGDDWCFCQSLKLKDFFDLMLYDTKQDYYLVEVARKGMELINKYREFFHDSSLIISPEMRHIENADHLKNTDLKGTYDDPAWEKGSDICFSCGACNHLCPTCYCFELKDETNLDMKTGKRIRTPSGCQLRHFTRVAGDHIFRPDRVARFKHRIFHQMVYFKEVFGTTLCTGCGRCIRGCPVRIDWLKIANELGEKR